MILNLTDDQMYDICYRRNANFDGIFFFGARDSKVYCCPSCKARTPLRSKIQYYESREQAESMGYRPCKRCRPDLVQMKDLSTTWIHLRYPSSQFLYAEVSSV